MTFVTQVELEDDLNTSTDSTDRRGSPPHPTSPPNHRLPSVEDVMRKWNMFQETYQQNQQLKKKLGLKNR